MAIRYLYGDSAPFPLGYNFLATLESFVAAAARAVQLDTEARRIQESSAEASVTRGRSVAALEGFHQTIMHALQESGGRSAEPQVVDYVRQVGERAAQIVEEAKRTALTTAERDQASARVELDRRHADIRTALEQFLTVARIPVLESKVTMHMTDGRNDLSAVFTHADGLVTSFTLAVPQLPAWQHARKVNEFAQGLDLMVGVRKSLFSRTAHTESVHIDDHYLTGFELSDDAAEIHLRRKVTDPRDSYVFRLRRYDTELHADVQRPSEVESETPLAVDHHDRQHLERLWQLLRAGVADALVHKERLVRVLLDGEDLFEQGKTLTFINRIIKMLAPTVTEISKRSPNPHELSLKMEHDGGRREEIYLKKDDLIAKLDPLSEKERSLFAPLSLTRDAWLSMSTTVNA